MYFQSKLADVMNSTACFFLMNGPVAILPTELFVQSFELKANQGF